MAVPAWVIHTVVLGSILALGAWIAIGV